MPLGATVATSCPQSLSTMFATKPERDGQTSLALLVTCFYSSIRKGISDRHTSGDVESNSDLIKANVLAHSTTAPVLYQYFKNEHINT